MSTRTTLTGIVVGTCPKDGCTGHLIAELSEDGSCWERDRCGRCDASWFNDPPRSLSDLTMFDAKAAIEPQLRATIRTLETESAELLKRIEAELRVVRQDRDDARKGWEASADRVRELEAQLASLPVRAAMVLVRRFQDRLETTWSWEIEATFALMIAGEEPTPERVAEIAAKLERDDVTDAAEQAGES